MARTMTLVFDEYPDDEIVLRLSPIPLGEFFALAKDFDALSEKGSGVDIPEFMRRFGDLALASWSFPEPATGDGLLTRDFNLALAIMAEWFSGVRNVPLPLPRKPSAGDTSGQEASRRKSRTPKS